MAEVQQNCTPPGGFNNTGDPPSGTSSGSALDAKTVALLIIALDVGIQQQVGPGTPFAAHVKSALRQGGTRAEVEAVLMFVGTYSGLYKATECRAALDAILGTTC